MLKRWRICIAGHKMFDTPLQCAQQAMEHHSLQASMQALADSIEGSNLDTLKSSTAVAQTLRRELDLLPRLDSDPDDFLSTLLDSFIRCVLYECSMLMSMIARCWHTSGVGTREEAYS